MQKRLYYKRAVTDGYSNSRRRNQTNITCHITLHYTVFKVWPPTLRNPLSLLSLFLFRFPSIFIFWAKRVMETNGVVSAEEVHVLAVDDSLVDRKVIERLLKISACKVTAVDSGIRALQFLGLDEQRKASESDGFVPSLKVDLVITDYCMPGMTGYELLKKIKESSTFREIPVVIMSSENILPRIDRCLEEGAEDFIVKPVKLSDVKRLKGYMTTKEVRAGSQDREVNGNCDGGGGGGGCVGINNKRKHQEASDLSPSPSPSPPSISSSTTLSSSPSSSPLSSPSSSPSVLDSPIRRLKMTGTD